jgi:hypothetical protein
MGLGLRGRGPGDFEVLVQIEFGLNIAQLHMPSLHLIGLHARIHAAGFRKKVRLLPV